MTDAKENPMTQRSAIHSTFTIARTYPHAPTRVFAAWADPATKARWFGGGTDESPSPINMDFRVGGHEASQSEPGADFAFAFDATYHDIVPDERIVFSYDLALGGALVSVSLATVELRAAGGGTQLTYTEHGAFLDGLDDPALREQGTQELLEALGALLEREAATA
jgi:uncharacterized protein YndB with AHSA1/START domain